MTQGAAFSLFCTTTPTPLPWLRRHPFSSRCRPPPRSSEEDKTDEVAEPTCSCFVSEPPSAVAGPRPHAARCGLGPQESSTQQPCARLLRRDAMATVSHRVRIPCLFQGLGSPPTARGPCWCRALAASSNLASSAGLDGSSASRCTMNTSKGLLGPFFHHLHEAWACILMPALSSTSCVSLSQALANENSRNQKTEAAGKGVMVKGASAGTCV